MIRNKLIYCYTNKVNGKTYVGQTFIDREATRKWEHRHGVYDSALYKAFCKYGYENFEYEVLCTDIPEALADDLEVNCIHMCNSYTEGYNLDKGGKGRKAYKASATTKAKQSVKRKGKDTWNKGLKNPYSQQALENYSKANTGSKNPKAKVADIFDYMSNELIASDVCIAVWAKENGYCKTSLGYTARSKQKQHKGIYAKYKENI